MQVLHLQSRAASFRFSTRFLLALVLAFSLVCAWISRELIHFRIEAAAFDALLDEPHVSLGVSLDAGSTADRPFFALSQLQHGRIYASVSDAYVSNCVIDSPLWKKLQAFRRLERLKIQDCRIDDSVDVDFAFFGRLSELDVSRTPLQLAHTRNLSHLRYLKCVSLQAVGATNEWLRKLAELTQLNQLVIANDDVSDAGVCLVIGLANLRDLALAGTKITSESARIIGKLSMLESLNVANTQVDDNFVENLGVLTDLKSLVLDGTEITDVGVGFLKRFPKLETLYLSNTEITGESLTTLSRIPNLRRDLLMADSTFIDRDELRRWRRQPVAPRLNGR
ncbi:MAG: hypothetical protein SFV81_21100 [Pirellulaceae bacterium]|nr:hypothetical protein [Pirellulaceae bacterium]